MLHSTLTVSEQVIAVLRSLVEGQTVIGFGAGRTARAALMRLGPYLSDFCEALVVASQETADCAASVTSVPVVDPNPIEHIPIYIDGADYINPFGFLLKGRGGAIAKEKVLAASAGQFVCLVRAVDDKCVPQFQHHPVVVEVFPWARSSVARHLVKRFHALPRYRAGHTTEQGNVLLDVFELDFSDPVQLERELNQVPGIVCTGLFVQRHADCIIVDTGSSCVSYYPSEHPLW